MTSVLQAELGEFNPHGAYSNMLPPADLASALRRLNAGVQLPSGALMSRTIQGYQTQTLNLPCITNLLICIPTWPIGKAPPC